MRDGADQLVFLEHWHDQERADAGLDASDHERISVRVSFRLPDIGDVHQRPWSG